MPRGPRGQKRPADVIGTAVMVGRIATGEVEDTRKSATDTMQSKGGKARAKALSKADRKEIAKKAARARWIRD